MAKIRAIVYSRTKNLGNFESQKASIEIELEPGDTLNGVRRLAQVLVAQELGEADGTLVADEVNKMVSKGEISDRGILGVL